MYNLLYKQLVVICAYHGACDGASVAICADVCALGGQSALGQMADRIYADVVA